MSYTLYVHINDSGDKDGEEVEGESGNADKESKDVMLSGYAKQSVLLI